MSEYQRYEFMTSDRPLTRAEMSAAQRLSSHIDVSSTHAVVEYNWGDFKHDPIEVLHRYFDGFLYWANWGSPRLAFRFPHGILPGDLLADDGYDYDEFVTFTRHADFDILDLSFGGMEPPDEWQEHDLGALMPIRDELMEGDLRALYLAWLTAQGEIGGDSEEEEEEEEGYEEDYEEDYEIGAPPIPAGLGALTEAQQALVMLLQLPTELVAAAARHSAARRPAPADDVAALLRRLPAERRDDYLARLARNEPGLSRLLLVELRALRDPASKPEQPAGERVPYATLLAESETIKLQREIERREQARQARLRRLEAIRDHQDDYWRRVDEAVERGSGAGYDEATKLLTELREAARHFEQQPAFHARFAAWVQPHLRRTALVKRLRDEQFPLPGA